jgi:saccharopine dehydrogenase (NADP+, L-glutamate forming)
MGQYEMYANRDSLLYRRAYQLEDIPTLIRGTLRHKGFCEAWDAFVQLGLTDDSYPLVHSGQITFRQFIEAYIDDDLEGTLEERVAQALHVASDSELMKKIEWTGIFSDELIGLQNATPAQILESLLLKKWKLRPTDKDMIIMQHEFDYILDGKSYQRVSRMVLTGNHSEDTAMSKLVGLPLGIFIKHVMLNRIQLKGVNIPVMKEVYQPVLEELSTFGVLFEEKITEVS